MTNMLLGVGAVLAILSSSVGCRCPTCFVACHGTCAHALLTLCPRDATSSRLACTACTQAHAVQLAASNCTGEYGRIEMKSYCLQIPTPTQRKRYACENGMCVQYYFGSYLSSACNDTCAVTPHIPPYSSDDPNPWYVTSPSRQLSYTTPRRSDTADQPRVRRDARQPDPEPAWPPPAAASYAVDIALQRGGCASAQIVLHARTDLTNISVNFDTHLIPNASWQAMQQLYVWTRVPNTTTPGLYPDPLMRVSSAEPIPLVRAGETQPIILRLCTTITSRPGRHRGHVIVRGTRLLPQESGLVSSTTTLFNLVVPSVTEVWDLVLPDLTKRALTLSVNYMDRPVEQPGLYPSHAYRVGSKEQLEWFRFLADWSIPANGNGCSGGMLSIEEYRSMAEAGARWISITDVSRLNCTRFPCVGNPDPRCPDATDHYDELYLSRMVETIRPVVESMSALGYGDRLYAYGFDESLTGQRRCDMAPSVRTVFGAVKRAFPNLTTVTAGFGYQAWGDPPPLDLPMDIWVSDYFTYCFNDTHSTNAQQQAVCHRQKVEVSRWRERHEYWWYWAGEPRPSGVKSGPHAHHYWLNPGYAGWAPLNARLLTWLAVAHEIRGVLYYASDAWHNPRTLRRVNNTMVADVGDILFNPEQPKLGRDGDGALFYPGQRGVPWPSLRLLNLAEGVADAELFAALPVESRRNLVGQLVPSGDIWLNDPVLMEFVRRQAAEEALVAARVTEASDNPSTLT